MRAGRGEGGGGARGGQTNVEAIHKWGSGTSLAKKVFAQQKVSEGGIAVVEAGACGKRGGK